MKTKRVSTNSDEVQVIGFRLDPVSRRILASRAAQLSTSPHALACLYVTEALHDQDERAALLHGVQILRDEMLTLREDVATVAEALLVRVGRVPAQEARDWIEQVFNRPCSPSASP